MLYDMLKCFIITAIGNPETETRRHADQVEEHIIRNALLELKEFEGKYSRYEELSGIFDAIDNLEEELEKEVV